MLLLINFCAQGHVVHVIDAKHVAVVLGHSVLLGHKSWWWATMVLGHVPQRPQCWLIQIFSHEAET